MKVKGWTFGGKLEGRRGIIKMERRRKESGRGRRRGKGGGEMR